MGMTMTQKILAAHAGLDRVEAGQLIEASLDMVLGNDITSPVAINEMQKMKKQTVFDRDKIALVMDHFIPNKDIKSAENCKCCRDFARRKTANAAGILRESMRSPIILMWEQWGSNMPFFRKKDW